MQYADIKSRGMDALKGLAGSFKRMGGEEMAGKALLNVYSVQVKNDLLSILIQNGYDVLEAYNSDELVFKYGLIKDSLDIYVHELDENSYETSLQQLQRIDRGRVRSIMLIHKYDSKVIDAALSLDVKDVVVLPIERENLKSKLLAPVYKADKTPVMPKTQSESLESEQAKVVFDKEVLNLEVSRATRGDYPLSIVMVAYSGMDKEAYDVFESTLQKLLRATDEVLVYEKDTLLLLCPFTPKDHLKEVESKVQEAYGAISEAGLTKGKMYTAGVTYPVDGEKTEKLMAAMKDSIYDSRLFGELDGPLSKFNRDEVRNRLRRYF